MWGPILLAALGGAVLAWPAVTYGARHVEPAGTSLSRSSAWASGAILGGGIGYALGWTWLLLPYLGLVGLLLALAVVDLAVFRLPNRILIPGGLVFIVASGILVASRISHGSIRDGLLGAGVYFALMAILFAISRGALGFGDVRLAVLLGWCTGLLGWRVTVTGIILGTLVGAGVAVVALIRGASRKSSIPYGPPMMLGTWLAIVLSAV